MASFFHALMRLAGSKRRPAPIRSDEEHQAPTTADSVMGSSTLPPSHAHWSTGPHPHRLTTTDDALTLFRLMLGITAAPHLGFSESPHRAADNIGLYARVVHSEQTAKDSYKVFSAAINACYFLQIIVAAALTALGAANADNKAITAFGAINTVIAGFLTYLKGSGYPARFKYCAGEWKKVREYIEHRERDLALEGCALDVYEVVESIRAMYDSTKREIEMSTPDGYSAKSAGGLQLNTGVDVNKAEAIAGKLRGLDDTVKKLRAHVSSVHIPHGGVEVKAEDVVGKLRGLDDTATAQAVRTHMGHVAEGVEAKAGDVVARLRGLEETLEKVKARVEETVQDGRDTARYAAHDAAHYASHAVHEGEQRAAGELRNLGKSVVREMEEHTPRPPREVSITVSHRDGDLDAEAVVRK